MQKLLDRYLARPTDKNAQAIRRYEASHPMARLLLSDAMRDVLVNAIRQSHGDTHAVP
jgi:hypothetical protein